MLDPGRLYLGRTYERTETHNLVPMLEGRSSIGRLGLFVHITAGFGDVGFCGYWTLEMFAVQPIRIYPESKSARSSTTPSRERSASTPAESTSTTGTFSPRCCTANLRPSPIDR